MKGNVARRPRFRRVPDLGPLLLTERDKAILSALSRYRFLTTSHIVSLVTGSRQNILRRLQRLYHSGFVDRPRAQLPLRFTGELTEFAYALGRKGSRLVASPGATTDAGRGDKRVSSLFLAHSLMVSDALLTIERSCRLHGSRFVRERDLIDAANQSRDARRIKWRISVKSGSAAERVGIIPDATFAIEREEKSGKVRRLYFFLEADRGTMPIYRKSLRLTSIRKKALAYCETRSAGVLKKRFGIPGFQVLFVARSEERIGRMNDACQSATEPRFPSLFLLATVEDLRTGYNPAAEV